MVHAPTLTRENNIFSSHVEDIEREWLKKELDNPLILWSRFKLEYISQIYFMM